MKKIGIAILGVFLSIGYAFTAYAESHNDYFDECESKLDVNETPGFHCIDDGIAIPSNTRLALPTSNNYLGRVTFNNPDVDGVFLCRNVTGTGSSEKYLRAGYIIQNRENGNRCFFDGRFAPDGSVNDISNTIGAVDGGTQCDQLLMV